MAIAYVANRGQRTFSPSSAATTITLTSVTAAAGDLVVLFLAIKSVNAVTFASVADNVGGNTWTVDAQTITGTDATGIASAALVNALSGSTITVTMSGAVGVGCTANLSAEEFSGSATASWFDVGNTATGSGTALTAGTTASAQAGDLGVACWGTLVTQSSFTTGAGYTGLTIVTATALALLSEYKLGVSGAQSATGTAGTTGTWAGAQATYKVAPAVVTANERALLGVGS